MSVDVHLGPAVDLTLNGAKIAELVQQACQVGVTELQTRLSGEIRIQVEVPSTTFKQTSVEKGSVATLVRDGSNRLRHSDFNSSSSIRELTSDDQVAEIVTASIQKIVAGLSNEPTAERVA